MSRKLRVIGRRFGRLEIVERVSPPSTPNPLFLCSCDCGGQKVVRYKNLTGSHTKSCGCLRDEVMKGLLDLGVANRARREAERVTREATKPRSKGSTHPLYQTWSSMIQRCYNTKATKYPYYGARGVAVCDQWRESFWSFIADMGDKPSPEHTLDRINPCGDYTPENCRWADIFTQATNRRVPGEMMMCNIGRGLEGVSAACKFLGVEPEKVRKDIRKGTSPALAIIWAWFRKREYMADGGVGGYRDCEKRAKEYLAARGIAT